MKAGFYNARQEEDETVEKFAQRLHSFKKSWPQNEMMSFERVLKCAFKKGCITDISVAIVNSNARSFDEILKQAMRVAERIYKQQEDIKIEAAVSRDNSCRICKRMGHWAKECPEGERKH